ncbi:type IV toxin-antitoxin system AbiEi family antitoxin domain-containing protein [Nocardioides marmoraquaticus]
MDEVERLLRLQAGVIARRQARAAGLSDHDIRRLLRRREWTTVHPGVYVTHNGPLTWVQRAWAAVLLVAPGAALWGPSALRAADGPGGRVLDDGPIHVAVARDRSGIDPPTGVRVHRVSGLGTLVQWNLGPPRMRYEEAALDVAVAARGELDVVAALAKACQGRRTTATRLLEALDGRSRVRARAWVRGILLDVAAGTCSVLEHGYLARVERPHGLPRAERQVRAGSPTRVIYRDAQYGTRCRLELDGRLFHDTTEQRDADYERDLDAAVEGATTGRLTYGQVFARPCRTTVKVVALMRRCGVRVEPHGCGPGCPVAVAEAA